jgi:hypothetical protein
MAETTRRTFVWRTFTSVFLSVSFLAAVISGAILFLSPPGRIANWTDWTIGSLTKQQWIALHVCFTVAFLVVAIFHVIFNWRPLVSYFKDRVTRRVGLRPEWLAALVVAVAIGWGTLAGSAPFSWLLAASENLKQSWDRTAERAPIPHAELLALSELASKAGVELAVATERLDKAGIKGHSPEIVVEQLAKANNIPAQRIYEIIQGQLAAAGRGAGGRGGEGASRGGGVGAGGHGGGLGWKTIEQMCAEEGLVVADVLARLKARGLKAEANQTLREIAVGNGFERPFELVEIIRGKAIK